MKFYEKRNLVIVNHKRYDVFQKGKLDENIRFLITKKRFLNIFPHINGVEQKWEYDRLKNNIEAYFKIKKSKEYIVETQLRHVDKKYTVFKFVDGELSKVDNFIKFLQSYKIMLVLLNEI